jgi:hypothetical protein
VNSDSAIGSLRIVPKRPQHVHGDNDDSTTTIAGKAAHMAGGIDLRLPVRSMRRHRQTRTRLVVFAVWLCVSFGVGLLAIRWLWPHVVGIAS